MPIVPEPHRIERQVGVCRIALRSVRKLPRAWRLPAIRATTKGGAQGIINGIHVMIQKTYQPQQYTLNVATSRITIAAGSEVGIGYALKTLYHYAISAVGGELPQATPLWTAPYTIDRPYRARRRHANAAAAQHPFLFPPIVLGAQRAWHPHTDKRSIGHFAQWMDCCLFYDHRHGIADIVCALATITERHQFDLVNASVLHCILLGDSFPYYRPLHRQFSTRNYDAFLSEMGSLHEALTARAAAITRHTGTVMVDRCRLARRRMH